MTNAIQEASETINEAMEFVEGSTGCSDFTLFEYATVLANEVKRLQDLHRPRDTRKGEWPEEWDEIHFWDGNYWEPQTYARESFLEGLWLPAPPSPEGT